MFTHNALLFTKLGRLYITTLTTASSYAILRIAPVLYRFLFSFSDDTVAFQGCWLLDLGAPTDRLL